MFRSNRYGMRSHASWGSQDDVFLAFVNQEALDRYNLNKEDYELLTEAEKEAKKAEDKKAEDAKNSKKKGKAAPAAKAEDKGLKVELDGIEDRIVRLTPNSSSISGCMVTPDGESLYYLSAFEKGYDLWKMDLRKHETKLLNKMGGGGADIQASKAVVPTSRPARTARRCLCWAAAGCRSSPLPVTNSQASTTRPT